MAVVQDAQTGQNPAQARLDDELATMTLFEHLAELRKRLTISVAVVVALAIVAWFLYGDVVHFMREPYCNFARHHPSKTIHGCSLVTSGPIEGVTTRLKISVFGGILLSSPVLFYELWGFITPGLKKSEKRYILPFTGAAVALFALGVTTAILVFPKALQWLIDVSGPGVIPLFTASKYFTLYALMCLIFGAVFMYPLVVVSLELTGVVPSATWRRWRRPAIVVIAIVAAVITPSSDPFSFAAMAIPMYIFYEASIILGRILHK